MKCLTMIGNFKIIRSTYNCYFIHYKDNHCDYEVAKALRISLVYYHDIQKSFNGSYDYFSANFHFKDKKDAIKCAKFLEEKYEILLKLVGD